MVAKRELMEVLMTDPGTELPEVRYITSALYSIEFGTKQKAASLLLLLIVLYIDKIGLVNGFIFQCMFSALRWFSNQVQGSTCSSHKAEQDYEEFS